MTPHGWKLALAGGLTVLLSGAAFAAGPKRTAAAVRPAVHEEMANLPLLFEANHGQTAAAAQYLARSAGSVVFLTKRGAVVKTATGALRMDFAGAGGPGATRALEPASTRISYFAGQKRTSTRGYGQIAYPRMYPGVDVTYYGHNGQLEYDLTLAPHADASQVALRFAGVRAHLAANGDLQLGAMVLRHPIAYQTIAGQRRDVAAHYVARSGGEFGVALGAYDASQPVVVDPVLLYATYLGGSAFNQANAVATDAAGEAFVAGYTLSADFPIVGGVQTTLHAGNFDAFVAKLSADGTKLLYSTYLGGTSDDRANGIAVDSTGAAYVTGATTSTDFPTTAGAFQTTGGRAHDAFVSKLDPTGATLVYSTYVGGTQDDSGAGIAVDANGDAFITGTTSSTDFPVSAGAPQATFGGGQDAFVAAINPAGTGLLYSSYLGGSGVDNGNGIAVDQTGNAYVVGSTASGNFPVTSGGFQGTNAGSFDGFVVKVDRSGHSFSYATLLGGTKSDSVNAIAVDAAGNAFLAGSTSSINIFPFATFQTSLAGRQNAFVAELNPNGSSLVYASYLGGTGSDAGTGIAVDGTDVAYVVGSTSSADFPVQAAEQATSGGVQDAFLAKISSDGNKLLYSSYMGGLANDAATGAALDASGDLFVVGVTDSANFPVSTGVVQAAATSQNDSFVAKFIAAPQGVFSTSNLGFPAQAPSVASTASAVVFTNGGEKNLVIASIKTTGPYTETDNCNANSSTLLPGNSCTINVVFTPTASGSQNGTLVVNDNAPGGSQTLPLTGSGGDFSLTIAPTTITIAAGSSASFSLNVTPATGYTQVVTLSCTGAPANTTCVPSPTTLTMNGTSASTATYTVTTTVRPSVDPPLPMIPRGPWTWLALFGLGLTSIGMGYALRQRGGRRKLGWAGTALLIGWGLAAVGCGGTAPNQGTPAGNYTLTFVGTAGSTTHNLTAQLTVD